MADPGDKVKIKTKTEEFTGILLPSKDKNSVVLKLDNGYNMGIDKKKVKEIKKIGEKKKLDVFPSLKIKQKSNLPNVSIIATGGTISSRLDYQTGAVKPLMDAEQIFSLAPEIADIVKIKKIHSPFMVSSENMNAKHWKEIAKTAAKLLNQDNEAVIITHGTDTLHYTAAALSFMLKNLNKPVILTYSQRSTDRGSTDTALNLICSAHMSNSNIAEVMLVGHGLSDDTKCLAIRGTKVRKMHTTRRDTFRPINDLPLAEIDAQGKIKILNKNHKKVSKGKVELDDKFEEKVALLKFYPGAKPELLDLLISKGYKGVVIEATGLGHVNTDTWLSSIKKAISKGIAICITSQCLYGRTDPLVYSEGRKLLDLGAIYLEDMLPETTYIKLGWVLGHTKNLTKVKEMMLTNYAGEINKRISPKSFLC